jgi:protein TonB
LRSLLVAAGLALILHGLLFTVKAEWMKKKPFYAGNPKPLMITMTHKKAQAQKPSQPELTLKPEPEKEPIKKEPPKKARERKPTKKEEPPPRPKKKPRPKPETRPKTLSMKKEKVILPPAAQPAPPPDPAPARPPARKEQIARKAPTGQKESTSSPVSERRLNIVALTKGEEKAPKPTQLPVTEAIPHYKTNPPPEYPRMARRRGYEGTVLMEVLVSREGRVEELRLLQSSGHGVLDREAIAAVKKWLFEPGRMGEEEVDMWVKVPVRFKLQ